MLRQLSGGERLAGETLLCDVCCRRAVTGAARNIFCVLRFAFCAGTCDAYGLPYHST